jgi:hypothetical protein
MWSLKQNEDGSVVLTYDRTRWVSNRCRGLWEIVGKQDLLHTNRCVEVNQRAGLLCCNDDEGNVRVLVLEE